METLDARKSKALTLVMSGKKLGVIAAELDVSIRTIQRWMDEPEFVAAVGEANAAARQLAIAQAASEMIEDLEEATESRRLLVKIRNDESAPIHARIRCAALLLARGDQAKRSVSENRGMGVSPISKTVDKPRQNTTAACVLPGGQRNSSRQKTTEYDNAATDVEAKPRPRVSSETPRQNTTNHDTQSSNVNEQNDLAVQSKIEEPPSQPLQNVAFSNASPPADPTSQSLGQSQIQFKLMGETPMLRSESATAPTCAEAEKARTLARLSKELAEIDHLEKQADEAERRGIHSEQISRFRAEATTVKANLQKTIAVIEKASPEDVLLAFGGAA